MIRLHLFGTPFLTVDEIPVAMNSRKAWSVIGYLALNPQRPVHRSKLAGEIWSNVDEAQARASLATTLWRLKSSIRETCSSAVSLIKAGNDSLSLAHNPGIECDIAEFSACAAVADRSVPDHDVVAAIERICTLHHGDFLDGIDDSWCLIARESFRAKLIGLLDQLVTYYQERQRHQDVVRVGRKLLSHEPFVEHVHRAVILALGIMGERAAAARQFAECTRTLKDELGLAPLPETVETYRHAISDIPPPERPLSLDIQNSRQFDRHNDSYDALVGRAISHIREVQSTLDILRRRP